jgi:hypothetical protein
MLGGSSLEFRREVMGPVVFHGLVASL